jgi:hypothetical protein
MSSDPFNGETDPFNGETDPFNGETFSLNSTLKSHWMRRQKKFCVCGHRESHQQDQHHLQLPEHFLQQAHGQVLGLNRPHLQQHPLKKAEMGFYAITLGFVLSFITKVNATTRSVNQNYLTKFAKVLRCVILHNRKINVTIRGTEPSHKTQN